MKYTKQQELAIKADPRKNLMIIAPPGSGKTECIAARVAYLLSQDESLSENEIWVTTFTNKAADEIKERIQLKLGKNTAVYAANLHKTAMLLLKDFQANFGFLADVHEAPYTIIDNADQRIIMDRCSLNVDTSDFCDAGDYSGGAVLVRHLSLLKSKLTNDYYQYFNQYDQAVIQAYENYCKNHGLLDFDDIINHTADLLETHECLRNHVHSKLKHLLVDEYQDISACQERLIVLMKGDAKLGIVGDDSQSIYGFRGADVSHFLGFADRFNATKILLNTNFRSNSTIIEASKGIVSGGINKYASTPFSELSMSSFESVRYIAPESDEDEADRIVHEIKTLQELGHPLKEIAILYRSHHYSNIVQQKLVANNIPSFTRGKIGFWDRKEIRIAMAYLGLANNPQNIAAFTTVTMSFEGVGKATINRCCESNSLFGALSSCKPEVHQVISKTIEAIHDKPISSKEFNEALSAPEAYGAILKNDDPDGIRLANIKVLLEFIAELQPTDIPSLIEQIYLQRDHSIEDGDAVQLMTMHASKGREFSTVFVLGFAKGMFPMSGEGTNIEDEERLCFVAMTRAKNLLYLCGRHKRPSRFLKSIPKRLIYDASLAPGHDYTGKSKHSPLEHMNELYRLRMALEGSRIAACPDNVSDVIDSIKTKWENSVDADEALDYSTMSLAEQAISTLVCLGSLTIRSIRNKTIRVSNSGALRQIRKTGSPFFAEISY